jgi:uncharacterized protein (TIGR02246 family)
MVSPSKTVRSSCGWLVFSLILIAQVAFAQTGSDEAAIRAGVKSYVEAYNRGDAEGVAEHWSEAGQWVSPSGEKHTGKEAIAKALSALFEESKGVTISVDDPEIRLITDDVAVEEGVVHVASPDASPSKSTYQAIHVKQSGKWQLHSVRETEVVELPAASGALQDLAWLVGEWGDAEGGSAAKVSWTKNKTFLTYSFKVATEDGDDLEGTQVIGWDPANETIRSWMFDSDGGFGEGVWSRRDNTWVVKFQQTLADGRTASATNVYTLVDGNSFTWKSIGRQVDGEYMPNIAEVKIARAGTSDIQAEAAPERPGKKAKSDKTTKGAKESASDKTADAQDKPKKKRKQENNDAESEGEGQK